MNQPPSNSENSRLFALLAGVVAICTLYFAQAVLVPLALAMVLSLLLSPLVRVPCKLGLPRTASVLLVVVVAVGLLVALGVVVTNQLLDVTAELPSYRDHIEKKLQFFHSSATSSIGKAVAAVSEITAEVSKTLPGPRTIRNHNGRVAIDSKTGEPVDVRVIAPAATTMEYAVSLLEPLAVALVVVVFTIFILLRHQDLRNRLLRLVGHNHLNAMTQALDDAGQRISKYLLLQLVVNVSYGLLIGVGLYVVGLPYALLWGALAAVCRFVPYLGPPVATLLPCLYSLAVFDGWNRPLIVLAIFVVSETLVASFVEPILYGARTGISSLAILVAAVFWTVLWGPIGLLLSTPLTVCLLVLGRYVPQLKFLHILLGDEPVITPAVHFYQRMIASDLRESREVLEQYLQGESLAQLYDSVVVPALSMAQVDLQRSYLEGQLADSISRSTRELVEELNEEYTEKESTPPGKVSVQRISSRKPILCVPARAAADETIATMVAQLLERDGKSAWGVSVSPHAEILKQVLAEMPEIVVISSLQPYGLLSARKLASQIRAQLSDAMIVVGLWNYDGAVEQLSPRFGGESHEFLVVTLQDAVERIRLLTQSQREVSTSSDALATAGQPI